MNSSVHGVGHVHYSLIMIITTNGRVAWRVIFTSPWNVFERGQIHGILRSLQRCSDKLDKQVSNAIREARIRIVQHQKETEQQEIERKATYLHCWISWLSLRECIQVDDLNRLLQLRRPKSCDWIFSNPQMISWIERPEASQMLWITGPPGSGNHIPIW